MPTDTVRIIPDATSQLVTVQLEAPTTGAGVTGIVFNTANLFAYYKRQGQATWTAISLVTMTQGTWVTRGFVECDATHAVGSYEVGIPDAVVASGVTYAYLALQLTGTIKPVLLRINLDTTISDAASAATDAGTATSAATALVAQFAAMITADVFTVAALANAPSGGGGGGSAPTTAQIAAALLVTPANKIATNASNQVVSSSVASAVTVTDATAALALLAELCQGSTPNRIFKAIALSLAPTGGGGGGSFSLAQMVNALLGGTQDPITTDASGNVVFAYPVQKNTAFSAFPFEMYDANGALVAGLVVTAEVSIDGGAYVACVNSPTGLGAGSYSIDLAAADLNCTDNSHFRFSSGTNRVTFKTIIPQG